MINNRRTWLVCDVCGVKEWVTQTTKFEPCQTCGVARYARDDNDTPMFVWTTPQDITEWS